MRPLYFHELHLSHQQQYIDDWKLYKTRRFINMYNKNKKILVGFVAEPQDLKQLNI